MGFQPSGVSFGGFGVPSLSQTILGIDQAKKDREAQERANEQNIGLAREQMAFQERMSNSAYQRSNVDMRAAGLNPMLAFAQGGASTPQGAMAHVEPAPDASSGVLAGAMGAGGTSAMETVRMLQEMKESNSRVLLNSSLGNKAKADAGLAQTTAQSRGAEAYIEGMKKQLLEHLMNGAMRLKENWNPSSGFGKWGASDSFEGMSSPPGRFKGVPDRGMGFIQDE